MIDGEHYPPVTASAIAALERAGHEVVAAVLAGGKEKLAAGGFGALGDLRVHVGDDRRLTLDEALAAEDVDAVYDLSDEPVLDYRARHALISIALHRGAAYHGADFVFTPPPRPRVAQRPSIAFIGTGKRTGKTGVTGFAARHLTTAGHAPVIVAMGRGGPEEPEVLRGDRVTLGAEDLIAFADAGRHAASDYIEDAMLGRVPAVGCRRCGGGLPGAVAFSNVEAGVRVANELPGDLLLLEGSGSSVPPVHADATVLIVPASVPLEYLEGYFGLYRTLLCDAVVVTMAEEPFGSPSRISEITSAVRAAFRPQGRESIRVVRSVFRPLPVEDVAGTRVMVATTAPEEAGASIEQHLEQQHGCEVIGVTHALSDRDRLEADISRSLAKADVLLCEIKAAGIDVAARRAREAGKRVVFMDNVPVGVDGDDVAAAIDRVSDLARARFSEGRQ